MKLPDEARELYNQLWPKGGGYSYHFHKRASTWFSTDRPGDLPAVHDVNFGLNPVCQAGSKYQRGRVLTVTYLAALFADFDDKSFGNDPAHTRWYVEQGLCIPPSAAVQSGAGIHAYWYLLWPTAVTSENLAGLKRLQKRWVAYVGADPGAADLARCPRVPGTLNSKYDPPRPVTVLWADPDYFLLDSLIQHLDTFGPPEKVYNPPTLLVPLPSRGRTKYGDRARAYGQAALDRELAELARTPKGGRNNRLNEAALKLAALAASGALDVYEVARKLYQQGLAMGTDESFTENAIKATIRSGLAAGLKQPRGVPNDDR